jgi:hypothetical protein
MRVSDNNKKLIAQEYFERAAAIKDKVYEMRMNAEELVRIKHDKERLMETRRLTIAEHENRKQQNLVELDNELAKKDNFIKKALGLNVI